LKRPYRRPVMEATTSDQHGLDLLAQGLSLYLSELERYRAVCLRRESSTAICAQSTPPLACRRFTFRESTVALLRSRVERYPRWEGTPFYRVEKRPWEQLRRRMLARATDDRSSRSLLCRG